MDFMFEDEVDEVGSDVEAYCPKCKADTTHVVISKYEDEIRRVQCNPCGDVHSFRKPRGEVEDDVPEPIAAKKRAMLKKATWEEFFAKHGDKPGKPYEFREHYSENAIVTHPKFGRGFVSEVMSDSKVEISFKDARRVLVHNRKDMPGLPLAAEGDGIPSKGPKAKAAKSKVAKQEAEIDAIAKLDAAKRSAGKAGPPAAGKPGANKPAAKTEAQGKLPDKASDKRPPVAGKKAAPPVTATASKPIPAAKVEKPGKAAKTGQAAPTTPATPTAKGKDGKVIAKAPAKPAAKPPVKPAAKAVVKPAKKKR